MITAAVLFCGCRNQTLDIESSLPEGNYIDILVKIDEIDEDYCDKYADTLAETEQLISQQDYYYEEYVNRKKETLAIMDSERYKYCKDGWRSAYCYCRDVHGVSASGLDYDSSNEDSTIKFADRFGSIKVMEYNANGIVNVSDEIVIAPKNKFGVCKGISYSSGTAKCEHFIYRKWQGLEPNDVLLFEGVFVLPCCLFFAIMLIFFKKNYNQGSSMTSWIIAASLFSLPNISFTICYLIFSLVPFFNINNNRFDSNDLSALGLLNFPWALCILGFVLIIRKKNTLPLQ